MYIKWNNYESLGLEIRMIELTSYQTNGVV